MQSVENRDQQFTKYHLLQQHVGPNLPSLMMARRILTDRTGMEVPLQALLLLTLVILDMVQYLLAVH